MAKQREDRYSDISAFIAELQRPPEPTVIEKPLVSPKSQKDWLKEGHAFRDRKQYQKAIEAYEEAIRLDPKDALAYHNKGNALNNLGRYEKALEAYEEAIKLDPKNAMA